MVKYKYVLMGTLLGVLLISLIVINNVETPLIERAKLPKCNNEVVIDSDLRYNIISYARDRIVQGTGESYYSNHFIFKNVDYSTVDCTFVVRYEYTYDKLHSDMSITIKVFGQEEYDIVNTNTFLRPVGLLVKEEEALKIAEEQNIDYSYFNIEIDIEQQTFEYKFYKESITEGNRLVFTIDAQSKEIIKTQSTLGIIPIV